MSTDFHFQAIGFIHSPYKEKFGIPRQPGLVTAARIELHLDQHIPASSLDDIEGFSHLWLTFVFHEHIERGWQPRIRPPRLGGNRRVGVFASRSPFRPNPIGLSVVPLLGIRHADNHSILELGGADLLDGTPILDIKPYVPFVDSHPDARGGFVDAPPPQHIVSWDEPLEQHLQQLERGGFPNLRLLLRQVLAQDPRPAYQKGQDGRRYGLRLYDFNILFEASDHGFVVVAIESL